MRRLHRRRPHGQSLTEFALIAPVLIVLLAGAAQFGAIVYAGITVTNADRAAARLASQEPNNSGAYLAGAPAGTACAAVSASNSNPVCNAVWNARGLLSGPFDVTITPAAPPTGYPAACTTATPNEPTDGYVQVRVSYRVPIFVPIVGNVFANGGSGYRTMSDAVEMRVAPCSQTNGN